MKATWMGVACALVALGWAVPSQATLDMQKKAKAAGIAVTGCMDCHVDKLPKTPSEKIAKQVLVQGVADLRSGSFDRIAGKWL